MNSETPREPGGEEYSNSPNSSPNTPIDADVNWDTTTSIGWMDKALCRDLPPNTFFPADGVGVEVAKAICATCPVKEPCLEYALVYRIDHGVWGGTSERERRRILKRRRTTGQ